MLTVNVSKQARKFLKSLPPKQGGQIARTISALQEKPFPQDSAKLQGIPLRRVDIGEYRIVYDVNEETAYLEVLIVGKRNDSAVYRLLNRKLHG